MTETFVHALQLGVIGLSGVTLLLAFGLLRGQQKEKPSDPSILRAVYIFMAFSFILTILNTYLQVWERKSTREEKALSVRIEELEKNLEKQDNALIAANGRLAAIRVAARSIFEAGPIPPRLRDGNDDYFKSMIRLQEEISK